ncbi:uncharacterized protein TRIADDRAFT_53934 [Trichoplax adhaerens]|uniref:Protein kinase domain-containing protein n=1 Tax=Trichoplax adhaerens TaxID=10228 RepID=B3RMF3_TRIAD|nr:hypothetical protein TRIADDRAFT_53934 [Trichoplax adhaerens]EDV27840.1 hypothetical protein TRIADDRAFT_53934 [Trichoplax adhaerens]|eukprot:XP_002109674.1 hypothetical protein TRIADDRAFT_53934 [Trichoplax adhaerens]
MGKPNHSDKASSESCKSQKHTMKTNNIIKQHNKQAKRYHNAFRNQLIHHGGKIVDSALSVLANQHASRKRYSEPAQLGWSDWEKLDFAYFQFLKQYKLVKRIHTNAKYTISLYKFNQLRVTVKHITNPGRHDQLLLWQRLQDEYKLLKDFNHPNIMQVNDWYKTKSDYMILMPVMHLNLIQYLLQRRALVPENDVKTIIAQVLHGLQYLHSQRYIHCNIRPCNIVFSRSNTLQLVLCGFTSAVYLPAIAHSISDSQCSKHIIDHKAPIDIQDFNYCAPELFQLHASYNFSTDCWSVGVLLYRLLFNMLPFVWNDDNIAHANNYYMQRMQTIFQTPQGEKLPLRCRNLIVNLLNLDVTRRWKVSKALENEWLNDHPSNIAMVAGNKSDDPVDVES